MAFVPQPLAAFLHCRYLFCSPVWIHMLAHYDKHQCSKHHRNKQIDHVLYSYLILIRHLNSSVWDCRCFLSPFWIHICGLHDSLSYWLLMPQCCIEEAGERGEGEPESHPPVTSWLFKNPDEVRALKRTPLETAAVTFLFECRRVLSSVISWI